MTRTPGASTVRVLSAVARAVLCCGRMPRTLALLPLGLAALLTPSVAWPCSPVPDAEPPALGGRVFDGPPALFAPRPNPTLPVFRRVGGSTLALALSEPLSTSLAQPQYASTLALYTTTAALGPGQYQLGEETFTIVDDGSGIDVDRRPALAGTTMRLSLAPAGSNCGSDVLVIELPAGAAAGPLLHILELEDEGNGDALRLVESDSSTLIFRIVGAEVEPRAERFCAKLTTLAWGGEATDELDLGCIDPTLASDPRVTRPAALEDDSGGCAVTAGNGALAPVLAALVLAWTHRRRRGSPSAAR